MRHALPRTITLLATLATIGTLLLALLWRIDPREMVGMLSSPLRLSIVGGAALLLVALGLSVAAPQAGPEAAAEPNAEWQQALFGLSLLSLSGLSAAEIEPASAEAATSPR